MRWIGTPALLASPAPDTAAQDTRLARERRGIGAARLAGSRVAGISVGK
jgi:hypothetical protein